jgi:hypothetical protein
MPKKKFIAARDLKIVYQVYDSKEEKQKRKSKFFYRDNVVLPLDNALRRRGAYAA